MSENEMDEGLENTYRLIMDSIRAEEVFGPLSENDEAKRKEALDREFVRLMSIVDPDVYNGSPLDKELAAEARERLKSFKKKANEKLELGAYGAERKDPSFRQGKAMFATGKREYFMGPPFAEGTLATLFKGECALGDDFAGNVAIKIANDPADNELLWKEAKMLKLLHEKNGRQRKHLPVVMDNFQTNDGRVGLVLRCLDECHDLYDVRSRPKFKNGIDRKHVAWIWKRLLSVSGYAHANHIVHANIEPGHIMIRPRDHNVFLIDWCWSCFEPGKTGDGFKIVTEGYSAPEVEKKGSPFPSADLYSIGKCMIYALGGDVETGDLPMSVEDEIYQLLQYFTLKGQNQRAQDAWKMHTRLEHVIFDQLGWPKEFLPFTL